VAGGAALGVVPLGRFAGQGGRRNRAGRSIIFERAVSPSVRVRESLAVLLDELSELEQMAAPTRRRAKGPVEMVPGDPNMQRARSHVHAMVRAMTLMDRRRALGRR
jgi:hypothetical protein